MADDFTDPDRTTQAAAAAAQAPEVDWAAFARTGADLARRSFEAFLTREGLQGTAWDPRAGDAAPTTGLDPDTVRALEEHDRRAGQLQAIATMAARYEEAVAAGAPDVDEWRADVIGAVDDYGLTGTLVDPRGTLPAAEQTPAGRLDQAYLTDAARARIGDVESEQEAAGDSLRSQQAALQAEVAALEPFAELPSVDEQPQTSASLQERMEQAYLDGYNERIQTGLAYDDADEAGKERVGAEVLTAKVLAYDELGRLARTLDAELPAMPIYEDAVADQPLTAAAEAALERSANLAGRWAGLDAGADDLIASVDSRTLEVTHAPSVYAGDPRDALFNYLDPDAQRAQRALPQIERDNAARAAITLAAAQEAAPERPGVRDRLRNWREARREQAERTGDDVQRRREAWERGNGRTMRVTGTPSAAATADVVAAPTPERGLGR
jgi:hypothetical protein